MLTLENICKIYRTTDIETVALSNVSLEIAQGEFVAIMGPSGCGKSTLLNLLGLLDSPTSGDYWFLGENIVGYSEARLTSLRRGRIGFVFQSFNLIDDLTIAENVEIALLYQKRRAPIRKELIAGALERVGMAHRARHLPQQLSGGEQQRVAIARALVSNPQLILADEPTGNLDTANGSAVMGLLSTAVAAGTTVVMVTHSLVHAATAKRTVKLLDGRVTSETQLAA